MPRAALGIAVLLAACAGSEPRAAGSEQTRALGQGYAQLYDAASGLRLLDEFLIVKLEADDTQRIITDVAQYSRRLRRELEQLAKDYPALSLEDDGLPALEKRKRELLQYDRVKSLAPLTGTSGADFDRTLLLTQSGALNQLRALVAALVEAEQGSPREAWIAGVQREIDERYVAIVELLDRRYFRPVPARSPKGAAGTTKR